MERPKPNLKSVIGCWASDLIAQLVKSHIDFNLFCLLLRTVKSWAKSRCIYGNNGGFSGRFSWALLAAYSCTGDRHGYWRISTRSRKSQGDFGRLHRRIDHPTGKS
ncbi:MAG: hypothetical protein KME17_23030 [Cyanosarcina radialis HA8281-LM2]|nr:hypothetical protein [Cyanosarcina radialis HA8281-LM2]